MCSIKNLLLFSLLVLILLYSQFVAARSGKISGNQFNPAISLILDGRYSQLDNEELRLPGFQVGGEAGYPEPGFSMGHNELVISANVDDKFYGNFNLAVTNEGGETVVELEEAYIETLGLGYGFNVKMGQFYSDIGYQNSIHDHAQDFTDSALVYAAMFGNHLIDTGVQVRWLAPIDLYTELGVEFASGSNWPGGSNENNNTGRAAFVKIGGDFNASSSWLGGISFYRSKFDVREAGGHGHGGEGTVDNELLDGESQVAGVDFIYKWAPNGNPTERNLKVQFEVFWRDENGSAEFAEDANSASADYDGKQYGYYVQVVYRFVRGWRTGLRYDKLGSDNSFSDFVADGIDQDEFEEESGLGSGYDPKRISAMVDYSPSEFTRFRLQYNRDETQPDVTDDQIYLQFIASLGSHGAHKF